MLTPGGMPDQTLDLASGAQPATFNPESRELLLVRYDIPAGDLAVALANAQRDPDGQIFPWRDGYPLVGQTVVYERQLWHVRQTERGPGANEPIAIVKLDGEGHDGVASATRADLRPVIWTAAQEDEIECAREAAPPTIEIVDYTACSGCGDEPDVLVPAETFGADEGERVAMCWDCAAIACEAAGDEVTS